MKSVAVTPTPFSFRALILIGALAAPMLLWPRMSFAYLSAPLSPAYLTCTVLGYRSSVCQGNSLVTYTPHFRRPLPSLCLQSILSAPLFTCLLVQGPPRLPMELELLPARPCPRRATGARNHQQVCKSELQTVSLLRSAIILVDLRCIRWTCSRRPAKARLTRHLLLIRSIMTTIRSRYSLASR